MCMSLSVSVCVCLMQRLAKFESHTGLYSIEQFFAHLFDAIERRQLQKIRASARRGQALHISGILYKERRIQIL